MSLNKIAFKIFGKNKCFGHLYHLTIFIVFKISVFAIQRNYTAVQLYIHVHTEIELHMQVIFKITINTFIYSYVRSVTVDHSVCFVGYTAL